MRLFLISFLTVFSLVTSASAQIKVTPMAEKPLPNVRGPRLYNVLDLQGSRGETVNFLIKISGRKKERLSATSFVHNTKKKAFKFPVRFYEAKTLKISADTLSFGNAVAGSYYDPLLPIPSTKRIAAKRGSALWVWGEVEIPARAPRGNYKGRLLFGRTSLPINLTVWKMQMPETPTFPMYGEIKPASICAGHYGRWCYEPREWNVPLFKEYLNEMARHNVYPLRPADHYLLSDPVRSKKGNYQIIDIFNRPTPYKSLYTTVIADLPAGIYYDLPVPQYSFDFTNMNELPLFANYFQALQNTLGEVAHPKGGMVFLWDEPIHAWLGEEQARKDIALVKQYTSKIRAWSPDVKTMITAPCTKYLKDDIDIFVTAPDYIENGYPSIGGRLEDCSDLQNEGAEVWWYLSCMNHGCSEYDDQFVIDSMPDMTIERNSAYIRSLAWITSKYNVGAIFYYNLVFAYSGFPREDGNVDPWDSVYYFTGNGDGTLFYPGRAGEHGLITHQPIPSIRLKLWRESSFDAEYIHWMNNLQNKPAWWQKRFNALVRKPSDWSKNYKAYFRLRKRIGNYLNKLPKRQR